MIGKLTGEGDDGAVQKKSIDIFNFKQPGVNEPDPFLTSPMQWHLAEHWGLAN